MPSIIKASMALLQHLPKNTLLQSHVTAHVTGELRYQHKKALLCRTLPNSNVTIDAFSYMRLLGNGRDVALVRDDASIKVSDSSATTFLPMHISRFLWMPSLNNMSKSLTCSHPKDLTAFISKHRLQLQKIPDIRRTFSSTDELQEWKVKYGYISDVMDGFLQSDPLGTSIIEEIEENEEICMMHNVHSMMSSNVSQSYHSHTYNQYVTWSDDISDIGSSSDMD